ncbi:TolC family outer membrane protein [Luteibacter pinisoli]|uniref:TolC family outer membrane protein n=1 Tax=Luteibacter pinisoli TaxID=2589080 RepID=A0A4Y5Z551_9GAMM|nr:TolC family outer membrane protein [Luteibacter pinisoli]QDE40287.1 TolC family outer membrane protein [Luteibacter pinisoli]
MYARLLVAAVALTATPSMARGVDLLDVYRLALASDPVVAQARADHRAALERARQGSGLFAPQLSLQMSWQQKQPYPSPVHGRATGLYRQRSLALTLNQRIIDRPAQWDGAATREEAAAAAVQLEAETQKLRLRVAEAYFAVLATEDALRLTEAKARVMKDQVDLAARRVDVGLAAVTESYEAGTVYAAAAVDVTNARIAAADSREALIQLTGKDVGALKVLGPHDPADERMVSVPVARSPRVAAAEHRVAAAQHRLAGARAGRLPTLGFQASYGGTTAWAVHAPLAALPRHNGRRALTVRLTLKVPLFGGTADASRVSRAIHQHDVAQSALESMRRDVLRGTRSSLRAVDVGRLRVDALAAAVASAETACEVTRAGLAVGTRNFADVLAAETRLAAARMTYSKARHASAADTLRAAYEQGSLTDLMLADASR